MKTIFYLLIISIFLFSCSTYKCYPSKRSKDYAYLQEGEISKDYRKTTLVSVKKTMRGNKHLFVTEQGDTIVRYYNVWLTEKCYYLKKDGS